MLDIEDKLMLMMDKAWARGISTNEFRKSDMSDLMFIMDMDNMREKKRVEMEHNQKVMKAMQGIGGGRHR